MSETGIHANTVKRICEQIRDDLTGKACPQIYPMAFDVIASTPSLSRILANAISEGEHHAIY